MFIRCHTVQFADLATVSSTAVLAEADDLKLLACTVVLSSLLGAVTAVGAQCLIGDRRTVLLSAAVLCGGTLSRSLAEASFKGGVVVFVNGLGMGQALMIVPAYAAELSSLRGGIGRGVLTSHPDGFVYLGCILGSLCHSPGLFKLPARLAWRLTIASGAAIPALLSSAVLLMPESPRWLVAQDELAQARRVLSRTSYTLEEAELRLLEIKAELGLDDSEETQTPTRSRWKEECATWRELVARPTEPLRRAFVSAGGQGVPAGVRDRVHVPVRAARVPRHRRLVLGGPADAEGAAGVRARGGGVILHIVSPSGARLAAPASYGCARVRRHLHEAAPARGQFASRKPRRRRRRHEYTEAGAAEAGEGAVGDDAAVAGGARVDRARAGAVGGGGPGGGVGLPAVAAGGERGGQRGDPVELRVGVRSDLRRDPHTRELIIARLPRGRRAGVALLLRVSSWREPEEEEARLRREPPLFVIFLNNTAWRPLTLVFCFCISRACAEVLRLESSRCLVEDLGEMEDVRNSGAGSARSLSCTATS